MSGVLAGLSQYADSDAESDGSSHVDEQPGPSNVQAEASKVESAVAPKRLKRKLPPLELDSLKGQEDEAASTDPGPIAKKVVRGDWLCYCFVELPIDLELKRLIQDAHDYIQHKFGAKHTLVDLRGSGATSESFISADEGKVQPRPMAISNTLHISLTRPFTVRSYERDDYVKIASAELQRLRKEVGGFPFSFSRIAYLANDDKTRHFMVLEVGTGRDKLHKISAALSAELRRAFRAKSYYKEARFHASTSHVATPEGNDSEDIAKLGSYFERLVEDVEIKLGPKLRRHAPIWSSRIGIQVANRIIYVDL